MHRSGVEHTLRLGVVLAFCVLAVGACGAPEEASPRPLPEETRKLSPGTYRSEEFEPAFTFRALCNDIGPLRISASWRSVPGVPYPPGTMLRGEPRGGGSTSLTTAIGSRSAVRGGVPTPHPAIPQSLKTLQPQDGRNRITRYNKGGWYSAFGGRPEKS